MRHYYDRLDSEQQSRVRAQWSEGFDRRIAELDLAAEFEAEGSAYSELAPDGTIFTHPART